MKLADYKASRGLSIDALAKRTGVHKSILSRVMRGEAIPKPDTMRRIYDGCEGLVKPADYYEDFDAETGSGPAAQQAVGE